MISMVFIKTYTTQIELEKSGTRIKSERNTMKRQESIRFIFLGSFIFDVPSHEF